MNAGSPWAFSCLVFSQLVLVSSLHCRVTVLNALFSVSLLLCNPGCSEVHTLKFCVSLLSGTGIRIFCWLQDLHVLHFTDLGPGLCSAEGTEEEQQLLQLDQADGPAS